MHVRSCGEATSESEVVLAIDFSTLNRAQADVCLRPLYLCEEDPTSQNVFNNTFKSNNKRILQFILSRDFRLGDRTATPVVTP